MGSRELGVMVGLHGKGGRAKGYLERKVHARNGGTNSTSL